MGPWYIFTRWEAHIWIPLLDVPYTTTFTPLDKAESIEQFIFRTVSGLFCLTLCYSPARNLHQWDGAISPPSLQPATGNRSLEIVNRLCAGFWVIQVACFYSLLQSYLAGWRWRNVYDTLACRLHVLIYLDRHSLWTRGCLHLPSILYSPYLLTIYPWPVILSFSSAVSHPITRGRLSFCWWFLHPDPDPT